MKYLFLLLPILSYCWTFKVTDLLTYNQQQIEVLKQSYMVGYQKDLQWTLTAIAIVESRAGTMDTNPNHICGAHQINTYFTTSTCTELESNHFLSALEALDNFTYWYEYTDGNWSKSIQHYNAGFALVPYSNTYLSRIKLVMHELLTDKQLFYSIIKEN